VKGIEGRKPRTDRKIDVKPLLPNLTKMAIYRLSFITQMPVKSLAEYLIMTGLQNKEVIDRLAASFQRDIRINNTYYNGDLNNPSIKIRTEPGTHDTISVRVNMKTNEVLMVLAYSLGCSKSRVCAVLIEYSMDNYTIVNDLIRGYLERGLDNERMEELKQLISYINKVDPNNITWAQLLSHIIEEVHTPVLTSLQDKVDHFLIHNWRDN